VSDVLNNIILIISASPQPLLPANIILTNNNNDLVPLLFVGSIQNNGYVYTFTSYEPIDYGSLTLLQNINISEI
jgi:hypothetical protein